MLSAIVVNWNGRPYLERCLRDLLAQVPAPDEILVVDNHSDDDSREFVAQHFPGVTLIDTGRNGGPSLARNVGAAAAKGDLLLFVDNDVVVQPGAIAELLRVMRANPGAAMVQARSFCGDDEAVVHYDGGDLHYLGTLVLHHWYRPLAEVHAGTREIGAAIALCFLMPKAIYLEVGGSDEDLFILYEDTHLSYKVRMRGHRVWLAADAHCLHLGGTAGLSIRGEGEYPPRRTFYHSRNRYYVLLTCMRWRTLLLTLPMQLLYGVVYALFGHTRGHGTSWWRGKWSLLCLIPKALAARGAAQRGRTVPDRDLLVAVPMTVNPGLADKGGKAAVRRGLDRVLRWYWVLVRRLCG